MRGHCTVLSILVAVLILSVPAAALPTPGLFGEEAYMVTGRYFPEALESNDYVGYFEAMDTLALLEETYPGRVVVKSAGESFGLNNMATQARDSFSVPIVEVTDPDSAVPYENKLQLLFMLSIHGNEKGGREGGLRIIEDFARGDIGMAAWTTQNGATEGTYVDYLEFMTLVFLFPNPDGWAHDEPEYLTGTIEVDPTSDNPVDPNCNNGVIFYCRTNGNNVDLNREVPTMGWVRERHTPLSEPESQGFANFIIENYHNLVLATDIHGMLNDENLVLTLLPAAGMTPHEMIQSTRMAEMLKERLNNDPHFENWRTAFQAAETAYDQVYPLIADPSEPVRGPVCEASRGVPFVSACIDEEPVTRVAGSPEINDWGTVWDTIGYVDSGYNGDFFAQNSGLDVPGYDIELAYNHLTFDSQYELGQWANDYHVRSVRHIVGTFMDAAAQDLQTAVETHGTRTAVVPNPVVVTNTDDAEPLGGWAAVNALDDAWDYANNDFFASPQQYFRDLKPFLKDGDAPGVLDSVNRADLTASRLARYDNLIIPGSAYDTIVNDTARIQTIRAWVEAGGNLVVTDSALRILEPLGLAEPGSVTKELEYAGFTNYFDRTKPLVSNIRGIARQTYEPVPLGFTIESDSAPNWAVNASKVTGTMEALGWIIDEDLVNTGDTALGDGRVRFLGSLLPDPTEEFYHPYGLESYATTYSGNQLLRNFLGWEQVFEAPPAVVTDQGVLYTAPQDAATEEPGDGIEEDAPMVTPVVLAAAFAALAMGMRRRRA